MTRRRPARVKTNVLDRLIGWIDPVAAARRMRARLFLNVAGSYTGASKSKRALSQWTPYGYDADSDILPDLPTLRERSRDLVRNDPLAGGALATKLTSVVGTGLRLQARIDRERLNLTDDQANAWERTAESEWRLFWDCPECDAARTLTGDAITRMVYRQVKENGDVFVVLPRRDKAPFPYTLRLQVVEADRICNASYQSDSTTLAGGVERDAFGAPAAYHILKFHPQSARVVVAPEWEIVPAFGHRLGLRNVLHVFDPTRPNQSRGVPDLAPVIEAFKQLSRYSEAELMAAVVSGLFTVFIESDSGDSAFNLDALSGETGSSSSDDDYKLAPGSIISLAKGEKIHDTNPGRPNAAFDPFVQAILRQIGVGLQLPFELLVKHFTASYSAARAALLEAWKYFLTERKWLADAFLQQVYEIWLTEAVALGRVSAPGYFADYATRRAYAGAAWVGPARGQIDEKKEIEAAKLRVDMGVSTLSEVTAEMTGGDWEQKHPQSVREHNARTLAGLTATADVSVPADTGDPDE